MTQQKHDTQEETESQVSFEALVKERLQYAVRLALMSVLEEEVTAVIGAKPMNAMKSVAITAMDMTRAIWKRRSDRLLICPFRGHEGAIRHNCLSAIIVGATNWMERLERCLSRA